MSPSSTSRSFGEILGSPLSDADLSARPPAKDLPSTPVSGAAGDADDAGEPSDGSNGAEREETEPATKLREPTSTVSVRDLQAQQVQSTKEQVVPCTGARGVANPAVQDLARQMLRNVSVHRLGDRTDLRLQIETRRMPTLGLSLRLDGGKLQARFNVPDRAGQDLLRSMAPELMAALETKGLKVNEIQVEGDAGPAERQGQAGGRHDQRQRGEQQQTGEGGHHQAKLRVARSSTDYVK
jgi:Flagellar hook-length control protein FliK